MGKELAICIISTLPQLSLPSQQEALLDPVRAQLEKTDGIRLKLCEDLKSSELCCFIFGRSMDEKTLLLFRDAVRRYDDIGEPKICLWFQEAEKRRPALEALRQPLAEEEGPYFHTFRYADTLRMELLTVVQLQIQRKSASAEADPYGYDLSLAAGCDSLGAHYTRRGLWRLAVVFYNLALYIHMRLQEQEPRRFCMLLASSYYRVGCAYLKLESNACYYLEEAVKLYKDGFPEDPVGCALPLAKSLLALLEAYEESDYHGGERFGLEAIELLEVLWEAGDTSVAELLASAYADTAMCCNGGETESVLHQKHISLQEYLAAADPVGRLPLVADAYFRYAFATGDPAAKKKAVILARHQPEHPLCKNILAVYTD